MHEIQDRSDLIGIVARLAPVASCRRACLTGRVENLGLFSSILFSSKVYPGWIVEITTSRSSHLVGIVPRMMGDYWIMALDDVPWQNWVGDRTEPILFRGDHPGEYKRRRDDAAKAEPVPSDVGRDDVPS